MSSTNGKVIAKELYPTPDGVVDALMKVIKFRPNDKFLEPCFGTGAIFNKVPLPRMTKSFAELTFGIDYLTTHFEKKDVIITNPPFSLTEAFLEKSMSELADDGTLIYLQRLNYLGSIKRVPFWARIGFPHKTPVIIPRQRFVKNGSDSCEYAWFIWDKGNRVTLPTGMSHLISEGK